MQKFSILKKSSSLSPFRIPRCLWQNVTFQNVGPNTANPPTPPPHPHQHSHSSSRVRYTFLVSRLGRATAETSPRSERCLPIRGPMRGTRCSGAGGITLFLTTHGYGRTPGPTPRLSRGKMFTSPPRHVTRLVSKTTQGTL